MPKLLVVTPPGPDADALTATLTDQGYDVARAANGSEALPVALRDPPDVVLMDSALSAMDRWHAVKRLNGEPRTSRIPVLTLAGDVHSPAGLQRVLAKLRSTLEPAVDQAMEATPVVASSRVASRPRSTSDTQPPQVLTGATPPIRPTRPAGSVPPVRPSANKDRIAQVQIGRREDSLDEGRLLVVDDNDLNRDMLSRRLKRRGYSVGAAESGERAVEMLQSERFDLVLLDWMMPGMSGIDVLQKIRERWSPVELPVIMATAKSEADDIVQALRAEANDYVTKPLNFDVVHARIRTQLNLSRAHNELLQSERRYRALLENTGDMIVQYALDGTVLYVSPASRILLGLEPDAVQRRGWYDGLHPIDRRELLSQIDAASLPTNFTYVARMERGDQSHIWVETSCRVLRDHETGAVQLIQAACRDVTEHVERISGDEPPLPLGGDIMAHPGWRSHTNEPPPPRTDSPTPGLSGEPTAALNRDVRTPIVIVGALDGLETEVLRGMTNEEIGQRVAEALRALAER
ncbi:MAG: response regulator [Alphaproteobacteria bacterium]|nr:response regulator [Alphaproteobacteria bacterium]